MNSALSHGSASTTTFTGVDRRTVFRSLLRPAIGFNRPGDVVKDCHLSVSDKRAILSSWASDTCAVKGMPYLRWMVGSDDPVPLAEVLEALARLDRIVADAARQPRRTPPSAAQPIQIQGFA
jgi:hypothetical protein